MFWCSCDSLHMLRWDLWISEGIGHILKQTCRMQMTVLNLLARTKQVIADKNKTKTKECNDSKNFWLGHEPGQMSLAKILIGNVFGFFGGKKWSSGNDCQKHFIISYEMGGVCVCYVGYSESHLLNLGVFVRILGTSAMWFRARFFVGPWDCRQTHHLYFKKQAVHAVFACNSVKWMSC